MPIFAAHSNRRRVLFRTAVVVTVGICFFILFSFFFEFAFRPLHEPIALATAHDTYLYYHNPTNNKKVALTFDDGPTQHETRAIMDVLERYNAPATFFFLGSKALIYPHVVSETARRGFEVGNHTFTHSYEVHTSAKRFEMELKTTHILLKHLTGEEARYYRPPFLLDIGTDPAPNPYLPSEKAELWALSLGYLPVGIDLDSNDWEKASSAEVVAAIQAGLTETSGGRIALFHEYTRTAEAVEEVILSLRAAGYTIVPLHEVLEPPQDILLTSTLQPGDTDATSGGEVSKLQWFLYTQKLFDPYVFTGVFDEETSYALEIFQEREGIVGAIESNPTETGVVGPLTRDRITAISNTAPLAKPPTPTGLQKTLNWFNTQFLYVIGHSREAVGLIFQFALGLMILRMLMQIGLLTYGRHRKKQWAGEPTGPSLLGASVIIPAYNEEENIRSTLESVVANTHSMREIIVVDDGSVDNTAAVVKAVMEEYPQERISLIQLENGGKANALTAAVRVAIHEILIVLDADAVLEKNAITYMLRPFADKKVAAVAGKVYTVSWTGFLNKFQSLEYMVGQNIDKRATAAVSAVGVVPGPAGAWRRDLVLAAGGFPTDTLVEDQDMTLTLLRMGYKIEYEPRAVAYTETPASLQNFLKQRFRWIYGMLQCFWKHKGAALERPFSRMTLLVLPNMLLFGILVPLTFPIADTVLIFSILSGSWSNLLIPILLFSAVDIVYVAWGLLYERRAFHLIWFVPLQRFAYRELIYYTVIRSLVHAIEGRTSSWNKFKKSGETSRFYISTSQAATVTQPASN